MTASRPGCEGRHVGGRRRGSVFPLVGLVVEDLDERSASRRRSASTAPSAGSRRRLERDRLAHAPIAWHTQRQQDAIAELRGLASAVPEERSLVDELLAERRLAAAAE